MTEYDESVQARVPKEPAATLDQAWQIFDPILAVDPDSDFYVPRTDHRLQQLIYNLEKREGHLRAFLCGHKGSGKTTELRRLSRLPQILDRFVPLYMTAQDFGKELVHLTHDGLLVEMGLALAEKGEKHGMDPSRRSACTSGRRSTRTSRPWTGTGTATGS